MAARFAPDDWQRRAEVVGRAEQLRGEVEPLADEDAAAYAAYLAERTDATAERIVAIPFGSRRSPPSWPRSRPVGEQGNPNLRGDATAGADLAAAAASIAARLVAINAAAEDERVAASRALAARAAAAAGRAAVADMS